MQDPPITEPEARALLNHELLATYAPGVYRCCPGLVFETPERVAAIVDFAYNLGVGRLQASTLRRRINQGNWNEAIYELRKWVNGGGKRLPGLVARREAEVELIKRN
jgi:lysozyme